MRSGGQGAQDTQPCGKEAGHSLRVFPHGGSPPPFSCSPWVSAVDGSGCWLRGGCRVPAIFPLATVALSRGKFHKSSPSLKPHGPSLRFKMETRPALCQPPSPGGGRRPQAPEAMAASYLADKRCLSSQPYGGHTYCTA